MPNKKSNSKCTYVRGCEKTASDCNDLILCCPNGPQTVLALSIKITERKKTKWEGSKEEIERSF